MGMLLYGVVRTNSIGDLKGSGDNPFLRGGAGGFPAGGLLADPGWLPDKSASSKAA